MSKKLIPHMPRVKPRGPSNDHPLTGFRESDLSWVGNNTRAVIWFLENHEVIRQAVRDCIRPAPRQFTPLTSEQRVGAVVTLKACRYVKGRWMVTYGDRVISSDDTRTRAKGVAAYYARLLGLSSWWNTKKNGKLVEIPLVVPCPVCGTAMKFIPMKGQADPYVCLIPHKKPVAKMPKPGSTSKT